MREGLASLLPNFLYVLRFVWSWSTIEKMKVKWVEHTVYSTQEDLLNYIWAPNTMFQIRSNLRQQILNLNFKLPKFSLIGTSICIAFGKRQKALVDLMILFFFNFDLVCRANFVKRQIVTSNLIKEIEDEHFRILNWHFKDDF